MVSYNKTSYPILRCPLVTIQPGTFIHQANSIPHQPASINIARTNSGNSADNRTVLWTCHYRSERALNRIFHGLVIRWIPSWHGQCLSWGPWGWVNERRQRGPCNPYKVSHEGELWSVYCDYSIYIFKIWSLILHCFQYVIYNNILYQTILQSYLTLNWLYLLPW